MQRVTLVNPLPEETDEQICLHNFRVTDQYHHLQYFISTSQAWLKMNPTKNYQDLEKFLRQQDMNTHLYAKELPKTPGIKLGLFKENDNTEYIYECVYSCRPKKYALEEVLSHWPTYDANFDQLKYAGVIMCEDTENIGLTNIVKFDNDEIESGKLIAENKKKINISAISAEQFLKDVNKLCKEKFNKPAEEKVMALANEGFIFGLFIDDKLVSNVGYHVGHNEKGEKIMQLLDLNNFMSD